MLEPQELIAKNRTEFQKFSKLSNIIILHFGFFVRETKQNKQVSSRTKLS